VLFDLVLVDEVGDVGGVVDGGGAVAIYGRVDKVLYTSFEGCVDEVSSLCELGVFAGTADGDLDDY